MKIQLLRDISISGVLAGFVVVVATTIVLSILSPFIFSKLVMTGDMDILMTSTGPLSYALLVILVSSAFGAFICNKVANRGEIFNTFLVVLLYAAFSYWLSTSPSNLSKPYPQWYVWMSYLLLLPGAFTGYGIFVWLEKMHGNGMQSDAAERRR